MKYNNTGVLCACVCERERERERKSVRENEYLELTAESRHIRMLNK